MTDGYVRWRADVDGLMTIYFNKKEVEIALTQGGRMLIISNTISEDEWNLIFLALEKLASVLSSRNMNDCSTIDFRKKVEQREVMDKLRSFGIAVLNGKEDFEYLKSDNEAA